MTNFKGTKMTIPFFNWVENIVGRIENAVYQHFLLFPQCFLMAFSLGSFKVRIGIEKICFV